MSVNQADAIARAASNAAARGEGVSAAAPAPARGEGVAAEAASRPRGVKSAAETTPLGVIGLFTARSAGDRPRDS